MQSKKKPHSDAKRFSVRKPNWRNFFDSTPHLQHLWFDELCLLFKSHVFAMPVAVLVCARVRLQRAHKSWKNQSEEVSSAKAFNSEQTDSQQKLRRSSYRLMSVFSRWDVQTLSGKDWNSSIPHPDLQWVHQFQIVKLNWYCEIPERLRLLVLSFASFFCVFCLHALLRVPCSLLLLPCFFGLFSCSFSCSLSCLFACLFCFPRSLLSFWGNHYTCHRKSGSTFAWAEFET